MCVAAVYFLNVALDLENNDGIEYQLIKARFRQHNFVRGHRVEYLAGPGGPLSLSDTNEPPFATRYRLQVELPAP